jgi:hypothetical protein
MYVLLSCPNGVPEGKSLLSLAEEASKQIRPYKESHPK